MGGKSGWREVLMAILAVAIAALVISILFSLTGCAVVERANAYWHEHPTEFRVFAGYDAHDSPIGRQPHGNVLVTQPLPGYMELGFQHISSMPDYYDKGEVNQATWGFCFRVPMKRCD